MVSPGEPSVQHSFEKKEDFEKRVVVYENLANVEDFNNHIDGFLRLVRG